MAPTFSSGLVWFRRDLRSTDHAALHHALRQCQQVHCAFVFDTEILDPLPRADRRVEFIRESLVELDASLRELSGDAHGGLIACHGLARDELPALARQLGVQAVFANHDDEPQALERDEHVRSVLLALGIRLLTFKDHTVFERGEVLTQSGTPYTVFTPYKNAWLRKIDDFYLSAYPVEPRARRLAPRPEGLRRPVHSLNALGFEPTGLAQLRLPTGMQGAQQLLDDFLERIDAYDEARDFPAVKGPSYLSVHLRFGTLSIRQAARLAHERSARGSAGAATWLSELIWRDFYFQVLAHHPQIAGGASFKPAYDAIEWDSGAHADALFAAWCEGRTGYPLVDAAMAQINQTGYMHNRLRMVVASFLAKDLGVDWRRGERYFAEKLNDFDLSANNGGWQWASSSGCDAQPYFRIFNPVSQSRKFDPEGRFIRRYLPQLAKLPDAALHAPWLARPLELQAAGVTLGEDYPRPVVDHDEARQRTLARYAVVKKAD
ncbi:cryptochrome/photolyase family protein [Paracidovorax wautersii]|uniref:Deoxyribodipyrimidine photo-lyase n=1 Tax=Paracidovorax wautersii TaxID=1177982 RepID=A0A1I2FVB8_9BURK|nr:deoxyribodipyrimidine photo-lyase [Paracidovorax wautersii]SFF08707.1 deoxyribodipyrimidine photo-lyase [Paracidovorax wautersii]